MHIGSRLVAAVVLTSALIAVPTLQSSAAPQGADCGLPESGTLDTSQVPRGLDVARCKIEGRRLDLGPTSLLIPAAGSGGVAVHAIIETETGSATGASAQIYTSPNGAISYDTDGLWAGEKPVVDDGNPDKDGCDTSYLGAIKGYELTGTLNVYVDNEGQPGGSAYTPADTGSALEQASNTWHNEVSPCLPEDHSRAGSLNYAGSTSKNADMHIVDGDSDCNAKDGTSVVDTGNLDSAGPGTYVGMACTWWNDNNKVVETDIRFNTTDKNFTYYPHSSDCDDNDYDVLSLMTHETGHTFGLKDQGDSWSRYQTMYDTSFPCTSYARNLGRSDVRHLRAQYPE